MSDDQRIRRPEPERTRPIRSWSTFGAAPHRAGGSESSSPDHDGVGEDIGRGVDQSYRLIDEYMRRGQFAARNLSERTAGGSTGFDDLHGLTDQMLRQAGDAWMLWMRFLSSIGGLGPNGAPAAGAYPEDGSTPRGPAEAGHPPPTAEQPSANGSACVSVHVDSAQPVTVAVDVRPGGADGRFDVLDLRPTGAEGPSLGGVTLERSAEGDPLVLRLHVPRDQPPGRYVGVVLDAEAGLPRGTVCVTLEEAEA